MIVPHETVPSDIAAAIEDLIDASRAHGAGQVPQTWSREAVAHTALDAAIIRHLRIATDRTEIIVPWQHGCNDCLHKPGFEAQCQCIGCPRQSRDIAPTDTGGVTHRIAGA